MGHDHIRFMGTAGARYVMARQLRSSAGVFLHLAGKNVMLDPGPGALVRCAAARPPIDLARLDAVVLTHMHIDHTGDANVLIDAMTGGGDRKRGALFAPEECLEGEDRVILRYVRGFLARIEVFRPETVYRLGELTLRTSGRHRHTAETYGVIFEANGRRISFMADTGLFPGLLDSYRGSDILVLNVVLHRHGAGREILHLSLQDVRRVIAELRPRLAVLTHLGAMLVRENPQTLSAALSAELGVETLVATDGMTVIPDTL